MTRRRSSRTSRSITHRSRGPSMEDGHPPPALLPTQLQQPEVEEVPLIPMERHVQRMEEIQDEILRLLRDTRRPTSVRGVPLLQHSPERDRSVAPPQHSKFHHSEDEIKDTASSTHLVAHQNIMHVDGATPSYKLREEVRRLVREEFPGKEKNLASARRRPRDHSPFAEEVLQSSVPAGFKLPVIDSYDGTTDPYEHIRHFRTIMRIQRATNTLLCQVFPATLKGQARTWIYSLPAGSINTFEELVDLFTDQFMANRRIIKDSSHLSGIRQNEGESLKEYFQRFSIEVRQIPGVDPELLRGVFLGGLRPGPFYSSLMRDTVHNFADLLYRVEAQITADEAISTHRKQFEPQYVKRKNSPSNATPPSQRSKFEPFRTADLPPRPPRCDRRPDKEYTPLNTSRVNILMAIRDKESLKWPSTLKLNVGDQEYYCHFHRSRGHKTEACFQLKEEIERLIKQGYLGQFVQEKVLHNNGDIQTGGQQPHKQQQENWQFVGEIATITGG